MTLDNESDEADAEVKVEGLSIISILGIFNGI
jgi:hypothetical protein